MSKRQRPASPLPKFPETQLEEDLPHDLYQPDNKRRKYFTPPSLSDLKRTGNGNEGYESVEEGDVNEHMQRHFTGRREWLEAAGAYKGANSLLHDLHAEQRHRLIFAPPPQHTNSAPSLPNPNAQDGSQTTFQNGRSQPGSQPGSHSGDRSNHPHQVRSVHHPPYHQILPMHQSQFSSDSSEATLVSLRYEDSNRLLRSLFLERRRELRKGES